MSDRVRANVFLSSDYGGIGSKNFSAYYGYEEMFCATCQAFVKHGRESAEHDDHETEWCFVATFNGETIRIPFSKLGTKDMFNVEACLLKGMAWLFEKYELRLPETSDE